MNNKKTNTRLRVFRDEQNNIVYKFEVFCKDKLRNKKLISEKFGTLPSNLV
jgi:hypothetical protein